MPLEAESGSACELIDLHMFYGTGVVLNIVRMDGHLFVRLYANTPPHTPPTPVKHQLYLLQDGSFPNMHSDGL